MSQAVIIDPFKEEAYRRHAMFALDVLDAITLERIGRGVKIVVEGLQRRPVLNCSGLHVFMKEDLSNLRRVTVDPRPLLYEAVELTPEDIAAIVQAVESGVEPKERITPVQLPPLTDEDAPPGITMLRGVVLDSPSNPVPLPGASAELEWRADNLWKSLGAAFPIRSASGTFIAVLRIPADDCPEPDAEGKFAARLRVRVGGSERRSSEMQLPWGKVKDAESRFYWQDLYLYP